MNSVYFNDYYYLSSMKAGEIIVNETDYLKLLSELTEAHSLINLLKEQNAWYKRQLFGTKADRILPEDPAQFKIPFDQDPCKAEEIKKQEKACCEQEKEKKKNKPRKERTDYRQPIAKDLPRVDEYIYPERDLSGAYCIGVEVTEKLEFEPGRLYVRRILRPKYIFPGKDARPVIGFLPVFALPKGNVGEGLLAHLVVSKYTDHLPLNRQIEILRRGGVRLASSTVSDWCQRAAEVLTPLYNELCAQLKKCPYVLADETPYPVLKGTTPGSLHHGYIWAFYNTKDRYPLFEYRKSRNYDGIRMLFTPDVKTVQSDGYGAYEVFETRRGCTHLCCWAHTRRKFIEAQWADPLRAQHVLKEISKLYEIESRAKQNKYTQEEIRVLRQEEAYPIILGLQDWLLEHRQKVRQGSLIGKAMEYMYVRLEKLTRYTTDGHLMIDTNLIERSIRPIALGRKNYLFAGSHDAAESAAVFYTLIGCCKEHQVNPFLYIRDMLTRVQVHKDVMDYTSLLPWNWKAQTIEETNEIQPDYQTTSWAELAEKLHLCHLTGKPLL